MVSTLSLFALAGAAFFALASASLAFSAAVLRGRPGLRFLGASVSFLGASAPFLTSAFFSAVGVFFSFGVDVGLLTVESSPSGLEVSPFLLAEITLSLFSFLTVILVRFFLSSLRSSFCFSASTFFEAPAIACSSRIL